MSGENRSELNNRAGATDVERSSSLSIATPRKIDQRETYNFFIAIGVTLLVALVVFVHLLVVYRS
jgi:hypothetical protein